MDVHLAPAGPLPERYGVTAIPNDDVYRFVGDVAGGRQEVSDIAEQLKELANPISCRGQRLRALCNEDACHPNCRHAMLTGPRLTPYGVGY